MKILSTTTLCAGLLAIGIAAHAQDTTYNWTGTGGFDAAITLDSPSSSGGSLSDIMSIYVLDPASDGGPFGPFANYPTSLVIPGFGTLNLPALEFDGGNASLNGPFTWNPSQITALDLTWNLGSVITLSVDSDGSNISYENDDAGAYASDSSGIYQAGSAPDAGSTSFLLGIAMTGLAGVRSKKRAA